MPYPSVGRGRRKPSFGGQEKITKKYFSDIFFL
jgi:hypothetical protein